MTHDLMQVNAQLILNSREIAVRPASLSTGIQKLTILGTQYAGEMKKGIFTVMRYLMLTVDPFHALPLPMPVTMAASHSFSVCPAPVKPRCPLTLRVADW